MFSNVRICTLDLADNVIEDIATEALFTPCGATQELSIGFIPPRGEHDAVVEHVAGQVILKVMIETRSVPADALRKRVDEVCATIEEQTGRKPGKKERRDITDETRRSMLPTAFPKQRAVLIWIDRENKRMVLDAATQSVADLVITLLVNQFPWMAPRILNTTKTPQSTMAVWLHLGEAEGRFQLERSCELKSCMEDKAVVRYNNHTLDIDEVKQHIDQGKLPTKLGLNWNGRVDFTLTESFVLKKVKLTEVVLEEGNADVKREGFDADVALTTGELTRLIDDLIEEHGGVMEEPAQVDAGE